MCGADWTGEALELTVTLPRIPCSSHAQTFPSEDFHQAFKCLVSAQDGRSWLISIQTPYFRVTCH